MKIIRTAFLLTTGFSVGAVYTLRHSNEIVDAIGDLKDEVVKAFSEQEDPEPLKKLLEYIADWDDDQAFITIDPEDDSAVITAGDIRSLSVDYEPSPADVVNAEFRAWDGIDRETRRAFSHTIEKMRDAPDDYPAMVANEAGEALITMGQLRIIHKALRPDINDDTTSKEITTT